MNALTLHYYLGIVVVGLALIAVWRRPERRLTLYAVTLQVLVGVMLFVTGLRVPWYHAALAVLAWAGYMGANAMARRTPGSRAALVVSAIASVMILLAFWIGMHAVNHPAAG